MQKKPYAFLDKTIGLGKAIGKAIGLGLPPVCFSFLLPGAKMNRMKLPQKRCENPPEAVLKSLGFPHFPSLSITHGVCECHKCGYSACCETHDHAYVGPRCLECFVIVASALFGHDFAEDTAKGSGAQHELVSEIDSS